MKPAKPIILDTDIGHDIDDAWALTSLLLKPALAARLVTTATGDTLRRCGIAHRLLAAAGRADIPLAAGRRVSCNNEVLQLELVSRSDAPRSYPDAAASIREVVLGCAEPVTLVCIAPMSNLSDLVERYPELPSRIDLVAMAGALACDDAGRPVTAEWNIKCDVAAAQSVFSAPWRSMTIAPLETCKQVHLAGNWLELLSSHPDALRQELGRQYLAWLHIWDCDGTRGIKDSPVPLRSSSTLYDTVAIHLAVSHDFLEMRPMKLAIDDGGYMVEREDGHPCLVATAWQDLPGYLALLAAELLHSPVVSLP